MVRTTSLSLLGSVALFVALGVAISSCSVIIDTKDGAACTTCGAAGGGAGTGGSSGTSCEKDEDCAALNNDFGDATCNSSGKCEAAVEPVLVEPKGCEEPAKSSAATVTLTFELSLTIAPKEPKPFIVHACETTDPLCASPVTEDFEIPYGELAQIKVKPGFEGYLEIKNPDGLPAMEFLGRPINVDTTGYSVIVPTPVSVSLLIAGTQETYNAERGIFVVTTRDCDRVPLAGVAVSSSLPGTAFIFDNKIPDKSQTETTKEGAAGFVNMAAGFPIISAIQNKTQKLNSTSAISRGGWVTYVEIFP